MYADKARKQVPTILRLSLSFRSRVCSSASTVILHSNVAPDVTSIKLSIPKPTSEMLPASAPAIRATRPSRLFHAMVKHSRRFPRSAAAWRFSATSTMTERLYPYDPSNRLSVTRCAAPKHTLLYQLEENRHQNQYMDCRRDHTSHYGSGNGFHYI